jgi:hypothetical protein
MVGKHPGREHRAANGQIRQFLLWVHGPFRPKQIERSPPALIGRRAKFREETPVTRQDEEPNLILTVSCTAQNTLVQKK